MSDAKRQHQGPRTLDRWIDRLLKVPNTIECPVMQILGRDFEPPLFTGSGYIHISSRTRMEFVMHATPRDGGEAFKRLVQAQKNPYSTLEQFRVLATDYNGTEWSGGWTTLHLGEAFANIWHLSGPIYSLSTDVSGHGVASQSGIEVVYDRKLSLPTPMNMVTSVRRGDDEVLWSRGPGTKTIEIAGTEIEFFHAPKADVVWATANTSPLFCHPYAENWVSEPLCLLLGQLVFPRLVARNLGNKKAIIWLRRSPPYSANTVVASILGEAPYAAHDRFWDVYHDILTMVIHARDQSGMPNFEAHPLTRYYHEIAQASGGSHWVLCMTLASVVEGVAKLLFPESERKSDYSRADIEGLERHIKAWKGDSNLRSRILGSLALTKSKGIVQSLNNLLKEGIIDTIHVETWQSVRNQVMHGELVSPWLDEELEQRLHRLIELTHRLSTRYVRTCVSLAEEKAAGSAIAPDPGAPAPGTG